MILYEVGITINPLLQKVKLRLSEVSDMLKTIPLVSGRTQSLVASSQILLSSCFIFYFFLNLEAVSDLGKMNEACACSLISGY